MPANCRCALEWQDLRSAFEKKAPNWGKRQFLTTMSLASYPEKKHYLYIFQLVIFVFIKLARHLHYQE